MQDAKNPSPAVPILRETANASIAKPIASKRIVINCIGKGSQLSDIRKDHHRKSMVVSQSPDGLMVPGASLRVCRQLILPAAGCYSPTSDFIIPARIPIMSLSALSQEFMCGIPFVFSLKAPQK